MVAHFCLEAIEAKSSDGWVPLILMVGMMTEQTHQVVVVLDPNFGEQLRQLWPGRPVWITMSNENEPVVRSLWGSHPDPNHLTGITGLRFDDSRAAEDRLLDELDTIELHHGPYSTKHPYTTLKVIGARLTASVRSALSEHGFSNFQGLPDGFIAGRTEEEARQLRS